MTFFFRAFFFFGQIFFFFNLNSLSLSYCPFCLFCTDFAINQCIHFLTIHKVKLPFSNAHQNLVISCFLSRGLVLLCQLLQTSAVIFLAISLLFYISYLSVYRTFLLEYSAFFGWSLELSFSPSLLQLVMIHMSIIYSIVILRMNCKLDLDMSWHDRGQAIVIDAFPLLVAHSMIL